MLRVYQTINLLSIFCDLFRRKIQNDEWNNFGIARWVYYFCGVIATIFPLGIIAIMKEANRSTDDIAIIIIFLVACILSNCIMILQKIWRIKYNDEIVVFRNSFGIVRRYKINDLRLIESSRLCKVLYNGKTIIQWDSLIMNTIEEVNFCRTISNSAGL